MDNNAPTDGQSCRQQQFYYPRAQITGIVSEGMMATT